MPAEYLLGENCCLKTLIRQIALDDRSNERNEVIRALPVLAEPYVSGAPEVEALLRVSDAGLRLEEVPVNMRVRTGGASKLRGEKAVALVVTVGAVLLLGRRALRVARHVTGRA